MGIATIGIGTLALLTSNLNSSEGVYEKWRDYLAPRADETKFEAIGWRGTFWSAVVESQQKRKPILLWAMNGHPLACT